MDFAAAADLAELVGLVEKGTISENVGKEILDKMIETGKDAPTLVEEEGAEQISNSSELEPIVEQAIEENPEPVEDYLAGKKQAVGALVGKVMQLSRGKADPRRANEMLRERLDEMEESG